MNLNLAIVEELLMEHFAHLYSSFNSADPPKLDPDVARLRTLLNPNLVNRMQVDANVEDFLLYVDEEGRILSKVNQLKIEHVLEENEL